jgi:hypothetical protein
VSVGGWLGWSVGGAPNCRLGSWMVDGTATHLVCRRCFLPNPCLRDDEGEHVKTMAACQDTTIMADLEERRAAGRRL